MKYRCPHCKKELERMSSKAWIDSYCKTLGRAARLQRVDDDVRESLRIVMECCTLHKVGIKDVLSDTRLHSARRVRWHAIRRLRDERKLSTTQIGQVMRRHHTSVLNALGQCKRRARAHRNTE